MQLSKPWGRLPWALRQLHTSPMLSFPRKEKAKAMVGIPPPPELAKTGMLFDNDEDTNSPDAPDNMSGGTSASHHMLQQQREVLNYMRLIEHDMPNLVKWRKPFRPPSSDTPLVVRTISYGGEEHPATAKRVIVVPVSKLSLSTPNAIHTCKLLAGTRWTPTPPRDSGISVDEDGGEHGFIKISCDDFPKPGMNLKWASDVLDRLVAESQNKRKMFANLPLDLRHITSKARKAKKGEHYRGSPIRPTIKDFPKEWLPQTSTEESNS